MYLTGRQAGKQTVNISEKRRGQYQVGVTTTLPSNHPLPTHLEGDAIKFIEAPRCTDPIDKAQY